MSSAATGTIMTTTMTETRDNLCSVVDQRRTQIGLALMRLTIGTMFVWVFFEDLGKGLYTATGYANLIHDYIEKGSAPGAWKSVMAFAAAHASMAAPLQAVNRNLAWCAVGAWPFYSSGCTRCLCVPLKPMDFGVGYSVDMGAVGSGDGFARARFGSSGAHLGPGCIFVAQAAVLSVVVANGSKMIVSVIIPTRNETEAIGRVLGDHH